ncbi:MAG: 50S ribosomal protein L23 [Candidatus Ryanbacteria bacterium]|nr:50S ribosomal protein L23 [Candidatus Ryanbacteria bacterium]
MALFDFLKKKRKQEKSEDHQETKREKKEPQNEEKPRPAFEKGKMGGNFVLVSPHITERAREKSIIGQYTFRIHPHATKKQVRQSVERLYGVHVRKVQITKVNAKPRRRGLTEGIKRGYKKAVVALRHGEAIDIF